MIKVLNVVKTFDGFRALDSQLGGTVGRVFQFRAYRIMAHAPIPILVDITSIDYQEVFFRFIMVDQQVVHDTSLVIREASILSLANRQHGSVVRSDALDESQRVRAFYPELTHVGNIEHTDAVHNGHVFVDNTGVLDRHVETCKFMHFGSECNVHVGKRSCFHDL